ncbi:apolipoprotein C-II [Syngnathoides biaculeatus]|uniref:apolipoprotein C-II n=1 Tax=Syngnathoides biaculeatus TaxID=300417 RepID=UPI002ADE4954|nr:apolipoprotein C-II [Syngnathoides biaculeatus]
MMRLLAVTVLFGLLALRAEGFRMPRQVKEEEPGPFSMFTNTIKSYYSNMVDKINDCMDTIKGLKIDEKIKNLYTETSTIFVTYNGILQDQLYHVVYAPQ